MRSGRGESTAALVTITAQLARPARHDPRDGAAMGDRGRRSPQHRAVEARRHGDGWRRQQGARRAADRHDRLSPTGKRSARLWPAARRIGPICVRQRFAPVAPILRSALALVWFAGGAIPLFVTPAATNMAWLARSACRGVRRRSPYAQARWPTSQSALRCFCGYAARRLRGSP